jgi:peptide/nickel transport system permease protein
MSGYILRRLLLALLTILGISIVTFGILHLTGDPARLILGELASDQALEAFRRENGLKDPLPVQYARFLGRALRGDFGMSLRYRAPVINLFLERVPATLELGSAAFLIALAVGIPVGIFSALRQNTRADYLVRVLVLFGQAVPGFYLGILLIMVFAVQLRWFPTGGRGGLQNLVLPAFALSLGLMALLIRFTRSAVLDVLRQDYIRTARAKGQREYMVIVGHALRNALIPVTTILGLQVAVLLSGAVVTETVFSWPGIGRFTVQAITARDFPIVQTSVLILSTIIVLANLAVDILYAILDPRIKVS